MKEEFLYYIWQHQLFNKTELSLNSGESLQVIKPGFRNQHNGPDFKEAHLNIGGIQWYGAVEMHVKASDWLKHGHQTDEHFDNVILHVVFHNDRDIELGGSIIPTLEVKGIYKPKVYHRYMNLIENPGKVPCAQQLGQTSALTRLSMLELVLIERLKRKSKRVKMDLVETSNDWQEVTFRNLAIGLGFKTNGNGMYQLAKLSSLKILSKQSTLVLKEALLLGLGGFLEGRFKDEYMLRLQKEYEFLKEKYRLDSQLSIHEWKFSPIRPFNYPTFRIVQLAALIHTIPNLWEKFLNNDNYDQLITSLQVEPSIYWQSHFRPDKEAKVSSPKLSQSAINNLLINVTAPLLVAYSQYTDNYVYTEKALNLLSALKGETNRITKLWRELNWRMSSAFDTQGLNELYSQYCQNARCLDCKIGHQLIRTES